MAMQRPRGRRKKSDTHEKLNLLFFQERKWERIYARNLNLRNLMLTARSFYLKRKRLPTIKELSDLTGLSNKQIGSLIAYRYRATFVKPRKPPGRKTKPIPRYEDER